MTTEERFYQGDLIDWVGPAIYLCTTPDGYSGVKWCPLSDELSAEDKLVLIEKALRNHTLVKYINYESTYVRKLGDPKVTWVK